MSVADVQITGRDGVQRMLRQYTDPKLSKRLQDATKEGANVFKAPVKMEAARVSKRLARSVSVRRAKRDRPATVLTFRPKVAYFRHWVLYGTQDHGPRRAPFLVFDVNGRTVRTTRVSGVSANPIIARVGQRLEPVAYAAIDRSLDRSEGL